MSPAPAGNQHRPFQLVTGRVWRGSAFGGVRGRSELPSYVEKAQKGEIPLDTFITHTMGLEDINEAFELMHEGKEHPHRHSLLTSRRGGRCGSPRLFHGGHVKDSPRTDRQPEDLRRLAPALPSFFRTLNCEMVFAIYPCRLGRAGGGAARPCTGCPG